MHPVLPSFQIAILIIIKSFNSSVNHGILWQSADTAIGRLLAAYGIKLSIDNGLTDDVVLEAKTTEFAKHYEDALNG